MQPGMLCVLTISVDMCQLKGSQNKNFTTSVLRFSTSLGAHGQLSLFMEF